MILPKLMTFASASALLLTSSVFAGPVLAPPPAEKELSIYDKIWAWPVLYKNKDNAFIQEFRFVGRLHLDAFTQDSDFGSEGDWVVRRLRFGIKTTLFNTITAHVEADFQPQNPDPLYNRLTDAYLAWQPCDAFRLSVGKLSVRFTMDGATSSNNLYTIDRNNLSNNLWFTTEYISGVNIAGTAGNWQWNTGYYSGGMDNPEFGEFNAGYFWLGSVGYDFGKALNVKQALLRADYVYNDPNTSSNATRPFEQIGSLSFQLTADKFDLGANIAAGQGFGTQPNVWGFVIMPSYYITKNFQAVVRYTYLSSADPNGIRLNRYENYATSGRGDEYNEFYIGLNYYFYGQKLKIQTGLDYADMKSSPGSSGNYHGWTWTTGLRLSF